MVYKSLWLKASADFWTCHFVHMQWGSHFFWSHPYIWSTTVLHDRKVGYSMTRSPWAPGMTIQAFVNKARCSPEIQWTDDFLQYGCLQNLKVQCRVKTAGFPSNQQRYTIQQHKFSRPEIFLDRPKINFSGNNVQGLLSWWSLAKSTQNHKFYSSKICCSVYYL